MANHQVTCPAGTFPHTIQAGDTLYQLSIRYNVSLDSILAANPGIHPDRLFIGQVVCIPSKSTPPTSCPTLRMGSQGPDVRNLQTHLKNAGFNPGAIDGIFGNQTHTAVVNFQKSKGLTPDGIVGPLTWTALGVQCTTPPPTTCPAGTFAYTIKSGDTFYILANRYHTTVEAIQKANPGVNSNHLQIGQIICIPNK